MSIKFYESPFHAIAESDVASKSVLKGDLTIMIRDVIESRGWTQKEASEHLFVSQPRISNIVQGKIDRFTLDMLFSMLDILGFKVECTLNESEGALIELKKVEVPKGLTAT